MKVVSKRYTKRYTAQVLYRRNPHPLQHRLPGLCCTNGVRDTLCVSSVIAGEHEQLVPYEVQDLELAFVQHGPEAARFAINLV